MTLSKGLEAEPTIKTKDIIIDSESTDKEGTDYDEESEYSDESDDESNVKKKGKSKKKKLLKKKKLHLQMRS